MIIVCYLCCRADRNDALRLEPESDRMERKTFVKEKICEEKCAEEV